MPHPKWHTFFFFKSAVPPRGLEVQIQTGSTGGGVKAENWNRGMTQQLGKSNSPTCRKVWCDWGMFLKPDICSQCLERENRTTVKCLFWGQKTENNQLSMSPGGHSVTNIFTDVKGEHYLTPSCWTVVKIYIYIYKAWCWATTPSAGKKKTKQKTITYFQHDLFHHRLEIKFKLSGCRKVFLFTLMEMYNSCIYKEHETFFFGPPEFGSIKYSNKFI